ncbi:MAG: hypothetical protein GF384_04620, partial [Elusimicrobia bacterium]|nr:hypothetical protein [Elusimicrobiota bacterium]MBD3412124.1 hypothetical protein [Elusimicrobiota bacterium]
MKKRSPYPLMHMHFYCSAKPWLSILTRHGAIRLEAMRLNLPEFISSSQTAKKNTFPATRCRWSMRFPFVTEKSTALMLNCMWNNKSISIRKTDRVVVLTGAGISAESGIKTFRDHGGLWENYAIDDVATPEGFEKNPLKVWRFYYDRIKQATRVSPNEAHYALVMLEEFLGDQYTLITQNIDPLHQQAGSTRVLAMHGELHTIRCTRCGTVTEATDEILGSLTDHPPRIPRCACSGCYRPHIVWFGEMPFHMD